MRFACVSDLHGHLPDTSGLDFDCLLIGGDIGPGAEKHLMYQANWYHTTFQRWLGVVGKPVIAVAGNHDFYLRARRPELPWTYLQDSGTTFGGLKIWGSPWQPRFHNWEFNAAEPELKQKWDMIPEDTDILLLHGPPYGYGDMSPYDHVRTGSPSLTKRILKLQPKLVVSGHIHSGYGRYEIGQSHFINASLVNEEYKPVNPIQIYEEPV